MSVAPSLGATGELAMIPAPALGRRAPPRSRMQFLVDLLPVIAFFVAYKLAGIYVATAVLIAGVLAQTAWSWFRHGKVSGMLLTSAVLVLLFGGLTLFVHDATFIKWKPSIVNWLFAAAFLVSQFQRGPTILQRMLGENVTLARADWRRLNFMWIAFFLIAGTLNLYVAYTYDEATWVNFKLFGLMGLTLLFAVVQGVWIARRAESTDAEQRS
jgi:intracellular septation protein